jgi:hypothetical protein
MCSVSHKLFVQAILVFSKNYSATFYVDSIPYVPTIHVHVNCTSLEKKAASLAALFLLVSGYRYST